MNVYEQLNKVLLEGEVNLTCDGTYLDESESMKDLSKIESFIKGNTLNNAAIFLGIYFNNDASSFDVQGSELVDKKNKDNKIVCTMNADKIASVIKED